MAGQRRLELIDLYQRSLLSFVCIFLAWMIVDPSSRYQGRREWGGQGGSCPPRPLAKHSRISCCTQIQCTQYKITPKLSLIMHGSILICPPRQRLLATGLGIYLLIIFEIVQTTRQLFLLLILPSKQILS